jgi:diadenosine tetraphosphate (Ap4A) HIT family hydrolase
VTVAADVDGCLACDLAAGRRDRPGGAILETPGWVVDHCVGPLGVGTVVVRPRRHVLHVGDLDDAEAAELGPLLQRTARAVGELAGADQVYVTLWSHAGGPPERPAPGHVHWVVQPVTRAQLEATGLRGPHLQVAMLDEGTTPPRDAAARAAAALRTRLGG